MNGEEMKAFFTKVARAWDLAEVTYWTDSLIDFLEEKLIQEGEKEGIGGEVASYIPMYIVFLRKGRKKNPFRSNNDHLREGMVTPAPPLTYTFATTQEPPIPLTNQWQGVADRIRRNRG